MTGAFEPERRTSLETDDFDEIADVLDQGGIDDDREIADLAVQFLHGVFSGLAVCRGRKRFKSPLSAQWRQRPECSDLCARNGHVGPIRLRPAINRCRRAKVIAWTTHREGRLSDAQRPVV